MPSRECHRWVVRRSMSRSQSPPNTVCQRKPETTNETSQTGEAHDRSVAQSETELCRFLSIQTRLAQYSCNLPTAAHRHAANAPRSRAIAAISGWKPERRNLSDWVPRRGAVSSDVIQAYRDAGRNRQRGRFCRAQGVSRPQQRLQGRQQVHQAAGRCGAQTGCQGAQGTQPFACAFVV